ncbi:TIGR00270 family protein [Candidatus Micrarchaeota archaeon]|nr:TIGR00270 family protein [Candidatus Micrarchaeota archaeon]
MEYCHVCGKEAFDEALVEGAKVYLCPRDLRFGTPLKKASQNYSSTSNIKTQIQPERIHEHELVDGFGSKIKDARDALDLTRKDLAGKLFIMENVLERIESESLKPDVKTAQKIQRFLKITIIKEASQSVDSLKKDLEALAKSSGKNSVTIGDVISFKTKNKK